MSRQTHVGKGDQYAGSTLRRRHAPSVSNLAAQCPTCDATVGEKCATPSGQAHGTRKRMATRLHNLEPVDLRALDYAHRVTGPAGRRSLRLNARLTLLELSALLDVHNRLLGRWERGTSQPAGAAGSRYGQWLMERAADTTDGAA